MTPIIEIKNIGKRYNITHQRGGYIALRDVLAGILKNPFKFAKIKARQAVGGETKEEFWALRNISLDIQKGDIIGIIGRNGAGKSTLLKILTGITPPTEGEIIMRGRVASLLEVGTGFHPELTGRENIFLNGAILGMTKKEIARKFDEIVAFSGVEKFLDTPVKYYSSGMYVRLAFSVAAHMEPDILLVDEVLAVGDAEFQKKCLGKMEEVTKSEGRTILFVSHNLNAVEKLCHKSIWIEQGQVKYFGKTKEVIDKYLGKENKKNLAVSELPFNNKKDMQVTKVSLVNNRGEFSADLDMLAPFTIEIEYEVSQKTNNALLSLLIFTRDGQKILHSDSFDYTNTLEGPLEPGKYKTKINFPAHLLNVGEYCLETVLHIPMVATLDHRQDIQFSIDDSGESIKGDVYRHNYQGVLSVPLKYETEKIK